jgi:hypothetical protein
LSLLNNKRCRVVVLIDRIVEIIYLKRKRRRTGLWTIRLRQVPGLVGAALDVLDTAVATRLLADCEVVKTLDVGVVATTGG